MRASSASTPSISPARESRSTSRSQHRPAACPPARSSESQPSAATSPSTGRWSWRCTRPSRSTGPSSRTPARGSSTSRPMARPWQRIPPSSGSSAMTPRRNTSRTPTTSSGRGRRGSGRNCGPGSRARGRCGTSRWKGAAGMARRSGSRAPWWCCGMRTAAPPPTRARSSISPGRSAPRRCCAGRPTKPIAPTGQRRSFSPA